MQLKAIGRIAALLACVVATGCATSRSEITIGKPVTGEITTTGKTVVIRSVVDARSFEEAPGDPSIPSLGSGGAAQASAEVKARAVGRKRNTYGKALGDILLQEGQTVEGLVRENLGAALMEAGYQLKSAPDAQADYVIDVQIKKFWAWAQPGFWAMSLKSNIETELAISGGAAATTISVHVEDSRQVATDGAWIAIIEQGLEEYRSQAKAKVRLP